MDFTLSGGPSWGTQGIFDTAMYAGADMSFGVPDGIESVRMDAVNGAGSNDRASSGWAGFFQDTARSLVGYSLARDAQQSGTVQPAQYQAQQSAQAAQRLTLSPLVLLAGGLAVFLALRK